MNASLPYLSHRWFAPSLMILAGLLGPWMGTDSTATWVVGGLLFLLLGLPHGAVDHITYHHAMGKNARKAPWRFMVPYLLGLGAFALLFVAVPDWATWTFLALAAWHFGQSHVEVRTEEWLDRVRGFALGAVLLGTLLGVKRTEALEVMSAWLSAESAESMLQTVGIGADMMKIAWTVTAAMAWKRTSNARRMSMRLLREAAWIVGMWYLASSADLLWAFLAYFCLGHAADSWRSEFLYHQELTKAFWSYYAWSWPFTIVALAGLAAVAWAVTAGWIGMQWGWAVLLAGTVPHMILLDHWAPAQLRAAR